MGVNTDEMRAAGLAWQAAPQGSEDELDLGLCLLEFANAAADEVDSLRAEVEALEDEVEALRTPRFVDAGKGWPPKVADFLRRQQYASHGLVPWPVPTDEIEQEIRAHVGLGAGGATVAERPDSEVGDV